MLLLANMTAHAGFGGDGAYKENAGAQQAGE